MALIRFLRANCDSSTIRYNIIVETNGGMESSGPWANLAHGIWLEFLSDFKGSVVEHNTCAHSGGFGLFLPNNFYTHISTNVFYNNKRAQVELSGKETNNRTNRTENLPQHNSIQQNILCAADKEQGTLLFRQEYDYGTMSNNYFCHPYRDSVIQEWGTDNKKWQRSWKTINQWQDTYKWADQLAKNEPLKAEADSERGLTKIIINDSFEERSMDVGDNGVYVTVDGDTITGSVVCAPFTSAVLFHTGITSSSVKRKTTLPVQDMLIDLTSTGRVRFQRTTGDQTYQY